MSCKQNICSMCGGASTPQPNFQKQVDPPIRPYGTILGDESPSSRKCSGGVAPAMQICLPTFACPPPPPPAGRHNPSQQPCIVEVPKDPVRTCPKIVCDPCPPPPPTKVWLIKSSPVPQKSACLPIGGIPGQGCSQPQKMVICLPCQPPACPGEPQGHKEKKGPIGMVTHCKELDLIGGKIVGTCLCGVRNGLSADICPRISCQNNPGCYMSPPQCWPKYQEEEEQPKRRGPPPPQLPKQMTPGESYPFAVPMKSFDSCPGRMKPPARPQPTKCRPNCIHVSDLKGERECTYHLGIPCRADCFNTKNMPKTL